MIGLNIIFIIIALIVAFFLFFRLLKSAIKALLFILFLVLFVAGILGFLVYLDVGKVRGSFENGQTALLIHEGDIVAGFTYSDNPNEVLQADKLELLSKTKLDDIDSALKKGSYSGEDSFTILIQSDYFAGKDVELMDNYKVTLDNNSIDEVFSCEELNDCISALVDAAPALKKQIASSFEDEQELKNKLFFAVFTQETKASKGSFLVSGIKENQIMVYPQLTTIKLLKFVPDKFINNALSKVSAGAEDEGNVTASAD
ncbi:MAG: hypothetical protein ACP5N3_02215 [Candidatus Nanoarchaeia archaeon]